MHNFLICDASKTQFPSFRLHLLKKNFKLVLNTFYLYLYFKNNLVECVSRDRHTSLLFLFFIKLFRISVKDFLLSKSGNTKFPFRFKFLQIPERTQNLLIPPVLINVSFLFNKILVKKTKKNSDYFLEKNE